MTDDRPPKVEARHLERLAVIYVRHSTLPQIVEDRGGIGHQREQAAHARRWGWGERRILMIEDLGISVTADREGFQRVLKMVEHGEVGMLLVSDLARLSRSSRDLEFLFARCRATGTLLAVDGVIRDLR